jgi:hypothetical protein
VVALINTTHDRVICTAPLTLPHPSHLHPRAQRNPGRISPCLLTYWHLLHPSDALPRPADVAGHHHMYLHNAHARADRRHIAAVSLVLSTCTATNRRGHRSCYCGPCARGVDWADSREALEAVMPPASYRSGWPQQRQRAGQQRTHTESRGCVTSQPVAPLGPIMARALVRIRMCDELLATDKASAAPADHI